MSGLLTPTSEAPIDMLQPVNWLHPLNRGLVAWYLALPGITGGARWMDLTNPGPHGHHGTLTNMDPVTDWVASDRPGSFGALDFDGTDDHVDVANLAPFERVGNGDHTVVCWMKTTQTDRGGFLSAGGSSINPLYLFGVISGGDIHFQHRDDSGTIITISSAEGINDGVWHLVAARRKGNDYSLLVDGVQVTSGTESVGSMTVISGNIGRLAYKNESVLQGEFRGPLDDVRLFDRWLSDAELAAIYRTSRKQFDPTLNWLSLTGMSSVQTSPWFFRRFVLSRSRAGAS